MPKIVLAGVDGSDTARRAARTAANLAVVLGAELNIVSAFSINLTETFQSARSKNRPTEQVDAYRNLEKQYNREAERIASGVADDLRIHFPGLEITSKAVHGTPSVALIDESEKISAHIIVLGNKRVQGPARVLGSIAWTVASEANCDVYIVNTHQR